MAANTARSILKNAGFLTGGEALNKVGAVFLVAALARKLGPDNFGAFSLAMVLAAVATPVADLGLTQMVFRDGAARCERAAALTGAGLMMRTVLLAPAFVVVAVFFFGFGYDRSLFVPVLLIAVGVLVSATAQVHHSLFRARGASHLETASFAMRLPLLVALAGWAWITNAGLEAVAVGYLAYSILATATPAVAGRIGGLAPARPGRREALGLLLRSLPLGLHSALVLTQYYAGSLILSRLYPLAAVGFLQAAARLTVSLNTLGKAFSASMLPHLVHVGNESRPRFEKAYYRSVKYMLGLGLPIAAGATALAPRIIELFYGTEFGEAVTPLRILVWDQVLVFWGFAAVAVLLARDCRWVLSAQAGIGAGVNIVAGLLLVPRWGASGAAVATLVSDVVGIVVVTAHLYRTGVRLPWRLSADVVTALAGCAAMIGLLRLAGNVPLLAAIPLGALGYGLALLVLRFLDNDEVRAARRALDTSAPRLEGATE